MYIVMSAHTSTHQGPSAQVHTCTSRTYSRLTSQLVEASIYKPITMADVSTST